MVVEKSSAMRSSQSILGIESDASDRTMAVPKDRGQEEEGGAAMTKSRSRRSPSKFKVNP